MWQSGKKLMVHLLPDRCRTVLVLGAGTSNHVGFPVGVELCSRIIENTEDPKSGTFSELFEMGFPPQQISLFHNRITESFPRSIDEFLADRTEFIDVGRAAIAQILLRSEDKARLFSRDGNWYGLLRHRLKSDINGNKCSPMIVSFNYDLSLEQFLFAFLSSTFEKYASINSLENIVNILHVHGRLGYVEYESPLAPRHVYGGGVSPSDILEASKGIRVPSELDMDFGRHMVVAQEAIRKAKSVIFLGFGYDEASLDRLRIEWRPGKYFGTAYGLEKSREQKLKRLSNSTLNLADPTLKVIDYLPTLECWNTD